MRAVFALLVLAAAVAAERNYYVGYKVFDLEANTMDDIHYLRDLMFSRDDLDFWEEPNKEGHATVMVGPDHQAALLQEFNERGIQYSVREDDVERIIREQWTPYANRAGSADAFDINDFNTYDDIMTWLNEKAANCPAGLVCELNRYGTTYEDRALMSMRLATGADHKPSFWVDSTIHAREWLAPATTLKIMDKMLNDYGTDTAVNNLLDNYDWYFVPVMNPDGYSYTWTNERLWRKNRAVNEGSACRGTDLNRNHAYKWGQEGVSTSPCSDLFCGSEPASELETQHVQEEIRRVNDLNGIVVLMTFHSYGEMWMHPWGNTINHEGRTCERADDHDEMFCVADATANAIGSVNNRNWARGTSCEVIYETTGGTDDWAKGVLGIKHAICPELRGNGFIVNNSQIQPSFEEIWAGLITQEQTVPTCAP